MIGNNGRGWYETRKGQRDDWAKAAAAKLRADGVDPTDIEAVQACLRECVGWPRLYDYWLEVYGPKGE